MTVRLGLSSIQIGAAASRPMAWLMRLQSSSLSWPVRTRAESMRASPHSRRCDSSRLPISRLNTQHRLVGVEGGVGRHAEGERRVVDEHVGGHEVVRAGDREVVDLLVALVVDGDDLVPQARRRARIGRTRRAGDRGGRPPCARRPRTRGRRRRPPPPDAGGSSRRRDRPGVGHDRAQLGLVAQHADLGGQRRQIRGARRPPARAPPTSPASTATTVARPRADAEAQQQVLQVMRQPRAAGRHHQPAGRRRARAATPSPAHPRRRLRNRASRSRGSRNTAVGTRRASGSRPRRGGAASSRERLAGDDVPRAAAARQRAVDRPRRRTARPGARCRWPPRGSRSTAWGRLVAARRPDQVGQHDHLVGGQRCGAEHRHRRRHPDDLARRQVGEGPPAVGVRNGWLAVVRTSRPDAVRTRYTGLTPSSTNALGRGDARPGRLAGRG